MQDGNNWSDQDHPSAPLTDYLDTPIVDSDQDFVAPNSICYGKLVSERELDDEGLAAQHKSGDEKLVDEEKSGGRGDCVRLVADELVGKDTIVLMAIKQEIALDSAQDSIAPYHICSNPQRKLVVKKI